MTIMQKILWLIVSLGNFSAGYYYMHSQSIFSVVLLIATLFYSVVGIYDVIYSRHSLNRLYPVVAYLRYFLESFRVEIQQYFIANNTEELPFNREQRTLVYMPMQITQD